MDDQSSPPAAAPVVSAVPLSQPQPPAQVFQPEEVHANANVNVAAVPREDGWVQTAPAGSPLVTPAPAPPPAPAPTPQPLAEPAKPEPLPAPQSEPEETVASESPTAKSDEDKSPLEILEEILASAGEEKAQQEKEAAAKKTAAEQEKAAMAAKEAQFKEEAAQKIAAITPELQAAQQQRDATDAQFAAPTSDALSDNLAINQLRHETVDKPA